MRITQWTAGAGIALVSLVACTKDDATIRTTSTGDSLRSASADAAGSRGNALVRFVNAADGVRAASLEVDGAVLFDSIATASVSNFREVDETTAHFSARVLDLQDTSTVAMNDEALRDGNRYSVILISENMASRLLRVLHDDVIPDSGKARLRVIHAASGGPVLDIRASNGTDNLFTNVRFKGEAGFIDVLPSTVSLDFRAAGSSAILLTVPQLALARGTATTVVVTGSTALRWFTFVDTMMPAVANR